MIPADPVLNLSPNIGDVDFNLVSTDADASAVTTPEFMHAVEYEGHGTLRRGTGW